MKITLSLLFAFLAVTVLCLVRNTSPAGVFHKAAEERNTALAEAVELFGHP